MRSRNMRRTRSLAIVVATCLLCLARPSLCDVGTEDGKSAGNGQQPKTPTEKKLAVTETPKNDVDKSNKNNNNTSAAAVPVEDTIAKSDKEAVTANKKPSAAVEADVKGDVADTENTAESPEQPGSGHATSLNSGAVKRGFFVFVGLSVLALAYMVFRSFRLNKSRTQMVRKYGVLAHKQDIEMRPLPLDEDDEDDTTVFDASGLSHPPLRSQS